MSQWREEKKAVLEAAQQMLHKGLVVGTAGKVNNLPKKVIEAEKALYDKLQNGNV